MFDLGFFYSHKSTAFTNGREKYGKKIVKEYWLKPAVETMLKPLIHFSRLRFNMVVTKMMNIDGVIK